MSVLERYNSTSGVWEIVGVTPTGPAVVSIATATTATAGTIYFANGTFTVTLPTPISNAQVTIKNTGSGVITVSSSPALIDGTTTAVLNYQYQSLTVVSDGTNWFVI